MLVYFTVEALCRNKAAMIRLLRNKKPKGLIYYPSNWNQSYWRDGKGYATKPWNGICRVQSQARESVDCGKTKGKRLSKK